MQEEEFSRKGAKNAKVAQTLPVAATLWGLRFTARSWRLCAVSTISMDMWDPFNTAVQETIDDADTKICFDRFYVASHFGL